MKRRAGRTSGAALIAVMLAAGRVSAHSGPPFPVVSNQAAGPYVVSVWTDPDTTDDGSAAGRFWIIVRPAAQGTALPARTHVVIAADAADRSGSRREGPAEPQPRDPSTYFGALVLDHEGPFRVHVSIDGPLGAAAVDTAVDATYDLRPAPWLIGLYLLPFVLAGFLWIKLLVRRRRASLSQPAPRQEPM